MDLGVRELVAHLDGPLPGAGPDIEDGSGVAQRRKVVPAGKGILEDLILEIETFGLGWVVGEDIRWDEGSVGVEGSIETGGYSQPAL